METHVRIRRCIAGVVLSVSMMLAFLAAPLVAAEDDAEDKDVTPTLQGDITLKQALEIGTSVYVDSITWMFPEKDVPRDVIKDQMSACLKRRETDSFCYGEAYDQYEKVLRVLSRPTPVTAPLTPASEKTARYTNSMGKAEAAWIAFRDAEASAGDSYVGLYNHGSVIKPVMAIRRLNLIRERIAELMFYYGGEEE